MSRVPNTRGDTRTRIVDAAAKLLHQQGAEAVTTRAVAEAAGVQAPAIYRLFGDKDGLLEAVAEEVMATYVSAKAELVTAASADDVDPRDDLRAGWQMQIDFGLANPALLVLLSDPARASRSPAVQSGKDVLRSRVHRLARTGRLRVTEQRAVEIIHSAGTGTLLTLLSTPVDERDPGLADDLFDAVLGRIITEPSDPPGPFDPGPVTVAVALRAMAPQLDMLSDAERRLMAEWLDRVADSA